MNLVHKTGHCTVRGSGHRQSSQSNSAYKFQMLRKSLLDHLILRSGLYETRYSFLANQTLNGQLRSQSCLAAELGNSSNPSTAGEATSPASGHRKSTHFHRKRARARSQSYLNSGVPRQSFRITGVSFEGRQHPLRHCKPGQPVMLVHEPSNPHDKHAVAVRLLNGTELGYVPRSINRSPAFQRVEDFGKIASVGPAKDTDPELYGANVIITPRAQPFTATAIPESLRKICRHLDRYFPEETWSTISSEAIQASRSKHYGVTNEPLVTVPVWMADDEAKLFILRGFKPALAGASEAETTFLDGDSPTEHAIRVFCMMNRWQPNDVRDYWAYQREILESRSKGNWHIDVQILQVLGVDIPEALQSYIKPETAAVTEDA